MDEKQIWQKIHDSYSKQDWVTKPSLFAESVIQYFPSVGNLLEIGGGLGQDSKYFANRGYKVVFTDISEEELLKYGVPLEWLKDVKDATEDNILVLTDHLPVEAGEALAIGMANALALGVDVGAQHFPGV